MARMGDDSPTFGELIFDAWMVLASEVSYFLRAMSFFRFPEDDESDFSSSMIEFWLERPQNFAFMIKIDSAH